MELYFIRHGSTQLNEQNKLRGWQNPPLSELGIKQSKVLAEFLKDEDVTKIYSSDLLRASACADMIGEAVGLPVITTKALRPINFGDLEGRSLKEIDKDLEGLMSRWQFDPNIKAPNGESFADFQNRTYDFVMQIMNEADKEDCIFLVTHIRVCLYIAQVVINGCEKLQGKDLDRIKTIDISPGNYMEIKQADDSELFRITGINQVEQEDDEKSPAVSAAGT